MRACDCLEKAVLPLSPLWILCWRGKFLEPPTVLVKAHTSASESCIHPPREEPSPEDPGTGPTGLFTLVTVTGAQAERLEN